MQRFREGDLTGVVEWFAASRPTSVDADPTVTFAAPGVPVPTQRVQAYILARLSGERDASSFAYELAPGAQPIPLAPIMGSVYDGETGFAGLDAATVEVVEGLGSVGVSATSAVNGAYVLFHVRLGVPLTIRASKSGYASTQVTHLGIRVHPQGFPDIESSIQHFRLTRR